MWAENTKDLNGTYDVDDSVTGIVRTTGPVITFNGAWAQNIGKSETFIDFMGDKGGIRHFYTDDFILYTTHNGMLCETKPSYRDNDMHRDEVLDFVECVREHRRNRNDISRAILTSKIMQACYDSSESHREVAIDR